MAGPDEKSRDEKGRWQPGQSGNPAGRRPVAGIISQLAEDESENCIKLLIEIRDSKKAPLALRKAAADAILDRGLGKPAQAIHTSGEVEHSYIARLPVQPESMEEWTEQTKLLKQ